MEDIRNQKVMITGATGFIGNRLCDYLQRIGVEVLPISRTIGQRKASLSIDIAVESVPESYLRETHAIVHCAARAHVFKDNSVNPLAEYRRLNVDTTLKLAYQAAQSGVRRFIFLSSIGVNGNSTRSYLHPASPVMFDESQMPAPHDLYAISKWEAECGLWQIQHETGMEVVVIRPPLVYGPGAKGNFAKLIKWVNSGIPLPLKMVNNQRSLLAVDNLMDFISLCLIHPKAANQTFLIADSEDISTAELVKKLAYVQDSRTKLFPVPVNLMQLAASLIGKRDLANGLLGSLKVNTAKAQELLGWTPSITMDEQLRKMTREID